MWGAIGGVFSLIGSWYTAQSQKKAQKKAFKKQAVLAQQEYQYQSTLQASAFAESEKEREFEWKKLQLQYSQNPYQYQGSSTTENEPIKKEYFLYILGGLGLIVLLTLRRK